MCDLLKRIVQKDLFDEISGEMVFNQLDQAECSLQKIQQTVSNFLKNTFAAIKPGGSLRLTIEQQTDLTIFNSHMHKTGFHNIEVVKTDDAIQLFGAKPNPLGAKKKLATQLRKPPSKMELTLKTPASKAYRVKNSLDISTTLTPCSVVSSPLKFKTGLRMPETPSHLYMEFSNPKDDFVQQKITKRKLSNSIIQQLNQVSNLSNEMKLHKEAAGAEMVRIKTERHLLKTPGFLQSKHKAAEIAGEAPEKQAPAETERPIEIIVDGPADQSAPKEEALLSPQKKISQQSLVSRNQRNGTLHVKFDKNFFEILKEANLEDNSFHT